MREPVRRLGMQSLALVALIGLACPGFARRPGLLLVTADDVEDSFHGAWLKMIYADACDRIGHDMTLQSYPAPRATAMSDAGSVDGEINRIRQYGRLHPDLIRIDPSHFSMNFCAYGHPALLLGKGWRGLSEYGQRRIAYRNGVARCREMLGQLGPGARVAAVNSATLGIRKLAWRRTDLYVDIDSVVERVLAQPEFVHAEIGRLSVVETVDMHCYLHRSRRALAQPLSAALAAMHREGTIESYRKAALAQAGGVEREPRR